MKRKILKLSLISLIPVAIATVSLASCTSPSQSANEIQKPTQIQSGFEFYEGNSNENLNLTQNSISYDALKVRAQFSNTTNNLFKLKLPTTLANNFSGFANINPDSTIEWVSKNQGFVISNNFLTTNNSITDLLTKLELTAKVNDNNKPIEFNVELNILLNDTKIEENLNSLQFDVQNKAEKLASSITIEQIQPNNLNQNIKYTIKNLAKDAAQGKITFDVDFQIGWKQFQISNQEITGFLKQDQYNLNEIAKNATFSVEDKTKWANNITTNLITWDQASEHQNITTQIENLVGNNETGVLQFDVTFTDTTKQLTTKVRKEIAGFYKIIDGLNELKNQTKFWLKDIFNKPTNTSPDNLKNILNLSWNDQNKFSWQWGNQVHIEFKDIVLDDATRELRFNFSLQWNENKTIATEFSSGLSGWGTKQEIIEDLAATATFRPTNPKLQNINSINSDNAWEQITWVESFTNNKYGLQWGSSEGNVDTLFEVAIPNPTEKTVFIHYKFAWRKHRDIASKQYQTTVRGWL